MTPNHLDRDPVPGDRMMLSRRLRVVALVAAAIALLGGCSRPRTNHYELEITAPVESERVRVQLDGHDLATFDGFMAKSIVSLDEKTPFPNAQPPAALTAQILGPDGWTEAVASIGTRTPEWIESELAKGAMLPLRVYVDRPQRIQSILLYVDNRDRTLETKIALGQAERMVAAGESTLLNFLGPTRDEGTVVRVDGVEVGRVRLRKVQNPDSVEEICWLVDVSGQHVYRRRVVVYQERYVSYGSPVKEDPGTILKPSHLHEIPHYKIDDFLSPAPSMVSSQDPSVSRVELVDTSTH
jgi:hypothetical protein